MLYEDDSESMVEDKGQVLKHEGLFGIEKTDWQRILFTRTALYPPKNKEEKTELAATHCRPLCLEQQCETGYLLFHSGMIGINCWIALPVMPQIFTKQ